MAESSEIGQCDEHQIDRIVAQRIAQAVKGLYQKVIIEAVKTEATAHEQGNGTWCPFRLTVPEAAAEQSVGDDQAHSWCAQPGYGNEAALRLMT